MKRLTLSLLLTLVLPTFLIACKPRCHMRNTYDYPVAMQAYLKCLELTSSARSSSSYTTNDDEDWDEVVRECRFSAFHLATTGEEKVCYE